MMCCAYSYNAKQSSVINQPYLKKHLLSLVGNYTKIIFLNIIFYNNYFVTLVLEPTPFLQRVSQDQSRKLFCLQVYYDESISLLAIKDAVKMRGFLSFTKCSKDKKILPLNRKQLNCFTWEFYCQRYVGQ